MSMRCPRPLFPSLFASALLLSAPFLCISVLVGTAFAADKPPMDPIEDPLLITAGFLDSHQDLKFRMLGLEAYQKQRYEAALQHFRRASFFADKPSQGMVAEMYWNGEGAPRDPVQAYVWMDLASERGYLGFIGLRERYWNALSAAERARAVDEGQAVYARFGDAAAKPRYEHQLRIGKREMTGSRTGFNHGVKIEIPGPSGSQSIEGSKYYDDRYWDAKKYWAWQDRIWKKPRIGKVTIGEIDAVETRQATGQGSRIPATTPEIDAPVPALVDPNSGSPTVTP